MSGDDRPSPPRRMLIRDDAPKVDQGLQHGLAPGEAPEARWRLHAEMVLRYVTDDGQETSSKVIVKKLLGRDVRNRFEPVLLVVEAPPAKARLDIHAKRIVAASDPATGILIWDFVGFVLERTFTHTAGFAPGDGFPRGQGGESGH